MTDHRAEALALAKHIRTQRKLLKEALRNGNIQLSDVLRGNPQFIQTMRLRELLLAVPKVGPTKVDRALRSLRLDMDPRLEQVPLVRREELLTWFVQHNPKVMVGGGLNAKQNRRRLAALRAMESPYVHLRNPSGRRLGKPVERPPKPPRSGRKAEIKSRAAGARVLG